MKSNSPKAKNKKNLKKMTKDERKKEKEEKKRKKQNKQKAELIPLPVVDIDEYGLLILEDGTYADMFEITTKDLMSLSEDDLKWDQYMWDKLYKIYDSDLKIISFSFPTDTRDQQLYFKYLLDKAENPATRHFLQQKLEEVEGVSYKFLTNSFVLVFYAKTLQDYRNKSLNIMSVLTRSNHTMATPITVEQKKMIITKLCNKNLAGGEIG